MVANSDYQWSDLGLPEHYLELSPDERREARLAVSRSWYDRDAHPDVVCTDPDAFVCWIRLFVEFYLKPADCNYGFYTMRDPKRKYDIVRALVAPPLVPTEPTKSIVNATRGFTKTVTVIHQAALGIAIARPGTSIVVSEYNVARTKDEIAGLRKQLEDNDNIHSDFGKERIVPGSTRKYSWNKTELEMPMGSKITGVSCMAAHRGRHPDMGIIDDPEKDKKKSRNPQWRKEYFDWYFSVWMPMFRIGKISAWIGTTTDEVSCIRLAMRGRSENAEIRDERFDDHHKTKIDIIERDPETGELRSNFEDYVSVEGYEAKQKLYGRGVVSTEYDQNPVADGTEVFEFHDFAHSFMKCVKDEGSIGESHYMLDCKTGDTIDWDNFVDGLAVSGACDIADSLDPNSDPAVTVIIGVDHRGTVYVLDVWWSICLVDQHVPHAFRMANVWGCTHLGWEYAGLQAVVGRWAERCGKKAREAGQMAPVHVPVRNYNQYDKKVQRIIGTVTPFMSERTIRFMRFDPVTTKDGVKHVPAECQHVKFHKDMVRVIHSFTDSGPSGYIDLADALEMALRVASGRRGAKPASTIMSIEEQIEAWNKAGLDIPKGMIPPSAWPQKWKEESRLVTSTPFGRDYNPYE